MGLTYVTAEVGNPADPARHESVQFLVDSGAVYSLVPSNVLRRLGIEPHSSREFVLANGEKVALEMGTASFTYEGRRGDGLVLFGTDDATPLLGATTLEGFGYVLDPYERQLRPLPMMLAGAGSPKGRRT
jgi:clan AA aspartic protease